MNAQKKRLVTAIGLALSSLASAPAVADNHYWSMVTCPGPTLRYWNALCWGAASNVAATLGQPQNGDAAYLYNTGATNLTVSYVNTAYPSAVLSGLYINAASTGTMTLEQAQDPLAASLEYIGRTGTGTFTQSGGTNAVSGGLTLGVFAGANGTYNLSGTGSLTAGSEYIGNAGIGSFSHMAGTNTVSGSVYLGYSAGSSGTYTLSGTGGMSTAGTIVGNSSTGTFTQSGGTHTVSDALTLGRNSGSSGTYTLSGSGGISTASTIVGNSGAGTFTQTGGTHTVTNTLTLADISGSSGTYNLNGGTLNAGSIVSGAGTSAFNWTTGTLNLTNSNLTLGTGGLLGSTLTLGTGKNLSVSGNILKGSGDTTLNIDGGTLSVGGGNGSITVTSFRLGWNGGTSGSYTLSGSGSLTANNQSIGRSGTGTFTQSGGSNTSSGTNSGLHIGVFSSGQGTYVLSGGNLSTMNTIIGLISGTGTFTQSGGTHVVSTDLIMGDTTGATGNYSLSGSGSLTAASQYIGFGGTGTFTQSGGTNAVSGSLYLGYNSGNSGTYTLSGGSSLLSADNQFIGYSGTGTFTQSGGTNTVSNDIRFANGIGSSGTYTLSGGTLTVTGNITTGSGTGTLNLDGGALSVGGGNGSINVKNLQLGSTTGSSGNYALSGSGSLTAYDELVGWYGTGAFTQSSGTHTVTDVLHLGSAIGSNGSYNLSGNGTLTAAGEYVGHGGTGTFTQSGGTHAVGGLFLGYKSGANGSYTLSDSGSLTGVVEYIGWQGTGTFTQSGGTHRVSNTLLLGYDSFALGGGGDGHGNYNLSGSGSLSVAGTEIIGYLGTGSFTQSGGTHDVSPGEGGAGNLILGYITARTRPDLSSSYTLSSGSLSVTGYEIIGNGGRANFIQTGGTHRVSFLEFSKETANGNVPSGYFGSGSYTLSGGSLIAGDEVIGVANNATFLQSGGTHQVINSLTLGDNSSVSGDWCRPSDPCVSGSYTLSGGSLSAVSETIGGIGSTFTQSGGTHEVSAIFTLGGSHSSYTLSDSGSLTGVVEYIGYNGSGTFTQSGGTHQVSNNLTLGLGAGSSGTYALSGGSLSAASETIGNAGTGTFNQSGGTHTVSGALSIGTATAGSGEYHLSGGVLNAGSITINKLGVLRLDGGVNNIVTIAQNGKLLVNETFAGNSQVNGNITLGALSTTTIYGGTLTVDNGTLTSKANLLNESSIGGAGTLALGSAGTLAGQGVISTNVSNAGTVNAKSGNLLLNGASFTNTGLVKNSVGANLFIESPSVSNLGHIQVNSGGSVVFDAPISNTAGKTVTLQGGTLGTSTLTNAAGGNVTGFGTITGNVANAGAIEFYGPTNVVGNLHNQTGATMQVRNDQTLITGSTVNDGTIHTFRGTVIFNGGLINNGVYISDPSTSYFTDLVVNAPGYLVGEAGDRFIISGNFENHSLQNASWNTNAASLILNGGGTQELYLAGADLGRSFSGYANNFAWGRFELAGAMNVVLHDGNPTPGGALYVGEMLGATLAGNLVTNITGNGFDIYYDPNLAGNTYLHGLTYSLSGNAGGLLAPVPEPETWAMLLAGLGLLGLRRIRNPANRLFA